MAGDGFDAPAPAPGRARIDEQGDEVNCIGSEAG
jgi:hypothetical protein